MALIEDTQVLQVLRGFNPWWMRGSIPEDLTKKVRRLAFYEVWRLINEPSFRRAVLLSGARRVGKTTILHQLAQQLLEDGTSPNQILYASFDHPILKLTSLDRIINVFQNNVSGGEARLVLLLDELHYAADWDHYLKLLVDRHPGYRIVTTGSASSILETEGAESGVGRWTGIKIPTLSFYEYVELLDLPRPKLGEVIKPTQLAQLPWTEAQRVLTQCLPLEPHFHRYLLIGGFPEMALMQDIPRAQRLLREDVVDKVLKRDMTALYGVRNILELERLFIYLCLHSGEIIIQDSIAKESGASRPTVANNLKYLEMANLIYRSDPIDLSGKKALKPKPKIYLSDPAIRNAVLLKGEEVLADPAEMGLIVETAVFKHLSSFYYKHQPRIGYWRVPRTEKEVDIVVALPNGKQIIAEVKYRENPQIAPNDGSVEFIRQREVVSAFIVTKRPESFGPLKGLTPEGKPAPFLVPAFAFLYLLGHAERAGLSE